MPPTARVRRQTTRPIRSQYTHGAAHQLQSLQRRLTAKSGTSFPVDRKHPSELFATPLQPHEIRKELGKLVQVKRRKKDAGEKTPTVYERAKITGKGKYELLQTSPSKRGWGEMEHAQRLRMLEYVTKVLSTPARMDILLRRTFVGKSPKQLAEARKEYLNRAIRDVEQSIARQGDNSELRKGLENRKSILEGVRELLRKQTETRTQLVQFRKERKARHGPTVRQVAREKERARRREQEALDRTPFPNRRDEPSTPSPTPARKDEPRAPEPPRTPRAEPPSRTPGSEDGDPELVRIIEELGEARRRGASTPQEREETPNRRAPRRQELPDYEELRQRVKGHPEAMAVLGRLRRGEISPRDASLEISVILARRGNTMKGEQAQKRKVFPGYDVYFNQRPLEPSRPLSPTDPRLINTWDRAEPNTEHDERDRARAWYEAQQKRQKRNRPLARMRRKIRASRYLYQKLGLLGTYRRWRRKRKDAQKIE